jgi:hypothetical protein
VFQIGRPQSEPVTSTSVVKMKPSSADERASRSIFQERFQRKPMLPTRMTAKER